MFWYTTYVFHQPVFPRNQRDFSKHLNYQTLGNKRNKKYSGKFTYMGVSKDRGTPKSSILIRFSIINHPFWGTTIFGNIHMDMNNSGLLKLIFFQIMATLDLHLQNVLQVVSCVWKTSPKSHPKDSTTLRIPIDPDPQWKGFFCCFFPIRGCVGILKIATFEGGRILRGTKHAGPKPLTSPAVQGQQASLPHDLYRGGE